MPFSAGQAGLRRRLHHRVLRRLPTNPAAGEECDDGGTAYEDGCDGLCQVEYCGDLLVQAGLGEICDEGGDMATCDGNGTTVSCGDGYPNPAAGEQRDDGSTDNGDGCDSSCQLE